jgi:hypothetical protein
LTPQQLDYQTVLDKTEALLSSPEFLELKDQLSYRTPNLWHILGISRKEVLVTRFLAWLFDPSQEHGIGDSFLKAFLIRVLKSEQGKSTNLRPVEIEVADLSDAKIETESYLGGRRCDILISTAKKKFLVLIENKVVAKESDHQTQDYFEKCDEYYPADKYPNRIFVFLTPNEVEAGYEKFIAVSYKEVLTALDIILKHSHLDEHIRMIIQQFRENIQRGITMDQKTSDLIQDIYTQYGEILEYILQNVDVRSKQGEDEEIVDTRWDGKSWFFNVGDNSGYDWGDSKKYSFLCAGGGKRYKNYIKNLKVGDTVYAYASRYGYVGIATVTKEAIPFVDAELDDGKLLREHHFLGKYSSDPNLDLCDWIALVKWEVCVEKIQAIKELPATPGTASKFYLHRKELMQKIRDELQMRVAQQIGNTDSN